MYRLILLLCFLLLAVPLKALEPDYAAIVNDEKISLTEFNEAVQNAKANLTGQNEIDFNSEEGKFILATTQSSILEDLINQKIIHQQAKKMGIEISDEEIKAEIAKLRKGFPSQKAFLETLAEENISEKDLYAGIKERLIIEQIKKNLTKNIIIPEKEITAFIKQNQSLFNQPKRVQFKQIVLASRSEAEKILEKLKKGASFADLVKQYSIDLTNKDNGGNLGFLEEGTLPPEIERVIFKLKENELSPILETEDGYAIFKCVQILAPESANSEKAREEARKFLLSKKENEIFEKWFQKIRSSSKIEVNPALEQKLPEEPKKFSPGNISNGRV